MFINKIAPFQPTKALNLPIVQGGQNNTQNHSPVQNYSMPTSAHYASMLAFTGGYSLNLEQTIEELEKYENEHNANVFPPSVREAAKKIIKDGDAYKWTLIDIHKDVFGLIGTIGNLDTLKEAYPIFNDVVSADDIEVRPGSFIDRVKNNELETFNPKNELSVDLIRLLYAEGLSINDIKKYTDNIDIYHAAHKRLGITLLHPHYAHVLKLSDKDYNQRLMTAIAATRQDNAERIKQSGEPVFIPKRKVTSDETANVGRELENHFVQNPEQVYSRSGNQHLFYEKHPEIAAKLTDLVLIAWGGEKHSSLTSKMKKHFKSAGAQIEIRDLDPFQISPENAKILKDFWGKNPWALKAFSDKMKNLRAQEIPERTPKTANDGYLFKVFPNGLVVDFVNWKKEKGIFEQGFYNQFMDHDGGLKDNDKYKKTYELLSGFFQEDRNSSVFNITNVRTVRDLYDAIKSGELKDIEGILDRIETFNDSVSMPRYDEKQDRVHGFIKANEIASFYQTIMGTLIKNGHKEGAKDMLDFLYKKLDENYVIAKNEIDDLAAKKIISPIDTSQADKNRIFKTVPQGFLTGFERWKKANGIDQVSAVNPAMKKDGSFKDMDNVLRTFKLINAYCDEHVSIQDAMADTYSVSLLDLFYHINEVPPKTGTQNNNVPVLAVLSIIDDELIRPSLEGKLDKETGKKRQYITTEEAGMAYQKVLKLLIEAGEVDYLNFLNKRLDQNFEKYIKMHSV